MATAEVDGMQIAFPTIVEQNGKLVELPINEAIDFALKNNEFAEFAKAEDAQAWADGGYKKGTKLEQSSQKPIFEPKPLLPESEVKNPFNNGKPEVRKQKRDYLSENQPVDVTQQVSEPVQLPLAEVFRAKEDKKEIGSQARQVVDKQLSDMGYNPEALDERGAEVLLLDEYKQKANEWKQFSNKRSEKYDFRQINKDLENAKNTGDFLNATGNKKRAYDDLVLDYLDYLYNSGQENKFRNTQAAFQDLSEQYKSGGLNATQEGDLERIYKEAMAARNIAAEVDYFDVLASTDINGYEKQLIALENEITQKVNNKTLTESDIQAYQIKMDQIRQQTGFTKEKEDQYLNAVSSFVDPKEKPIYTGSLDAQQNKNTKQKGEAYVDAKDGGAGDAAEGMVKGYVGTVGQMMVSMLQAPKAIGDAFGDEDFDWVDELDA